MHEGERLLPPRSATRLKRAGTWLAKHLKELVDYESTQAREARFARDYVKDIPEGRSKNRRDTLFYEKQTDPQTGNQQIIISGDFVLRQGVSRGMPYYWRVDVAQGLTAEAITIARIIPTEEGGVMDGLCEIAADSTVREDNLPVKQAVDILERASKLHAAQA